MDNEPLLTSEEVAARLGRNKATIERWRREGIIPAAVAEKRCLRFRWSEVMETLEKRAKESQER
jgi:predicted site-specific integrase-resolvase